MNFLPQFAWPGSIWAAAGGILVCGVGLAQSGGGAAAELPAVTRENPESAGSVDGLGAKAAMAGSPETAAGPDDAAPEDTGRGAAVTQLSEDQDELVSMVQRLRDSLASDQAEQLGQDLDAVNDPALEALWAIADDQINQETVLAENEVIERLLDIARKAAGQGGGGGQGQGQGQGQGNSSAQALLNMMEQMAGRQPQRQPGGQPSDSQTPGGGGGNGQGPGGRGGQGGPGTELTQNGVDHGSHQRRVPAAAGNPPLTLPEEYRENLESYFRALEDQR